MFQSRFFFSAMVLLSPLLSERSKAEELTAYQRELGTLRLKLQELFKERTLMQAAGKKMLPARERQLESLQGRRWFIDPLWRLQAALSEDSSALSAIPWDDDEERKELMRFYQDALSLVYELPRPASLEASEDLAKRLRVAIIRRDLPLARVEATKAKTKN